LDQDYCQAKTVSVLHEGTDSLSSSSVFVMHHYIIYLSTSCVYNFHIKCLHEGLQALIFSHCHKQCINMYFTQLIYVFIIHSLSTLPTYLYNQQTVICINVH